MARLNYLLSRKKVVGFSFRLITHSHGCCAYTYLKKKKKVQEMRRLEGSAPKQILVVIAVANSWIW